jgi:membrane protein implicated in regulation of membrane protease activity
MPFVRGGPRRGPGRFLHWKIRLIVAGAVLLLLGMARELDLLVLCAIVVLAGAFALRFFEKDDDGEQGDAGMEDDAEPYDRHATDLKGDGMRPAE